MQSYYLGMFVLLKPAMLFQDLYCVRSDLGNLLKALGRLDEAKVNTKASQSLIRSEVNRILCNSHLSTV